MSEIAKHMSLSSADQPVSRLQHLAQSIVSGRLSRLERGRLSIVLPDGEALTFGRSGSEATIHVHDPVFFKRLIAGSDVGAGESFMAGDWSTPDLVGLTRLFLDNEALFDPHPVLGMLKRLGDRVVHLARSNTLKRAPRNIAAHYAETLRRWRGTFLSRLSEVEGLGFDGRFKRMWEFYLATCEAAFSHGKLGTLQLVLARPGQRAARGIGSSNSVTVG